MLFEHHKVDIFSIQKTLTEDYHFKLNTADALNLVCENMKH